MTHKVQVEYGNVGVDFKFIPREGFGWMNASYQVGLGYMDRGLRRALGAVMDPTKVFHSRSQASLLAIANAAKVDANKRDNSIDAVIKKTAGGESGSGLVDSGSNRSNIDVNRISSELQQLLLPHHPAEQHHHPVGHQSLVEQPLDVTTRLRRPHRT